MIPTPPLTALAGALLLLICIASMGNPVVFVLSYAVALVTSAGALFRGKGR